MMESFEIGRCLAERVPTYRVTAPGIDRALACVRRSGAALGPSLVAVEGTHGAPRVEAWGSHALGAFLGREVGGEPSGLLRFHRLGRAGGFELWTRGERLRTALGREPWGCSVLDRRRRPVLEIHRPARWHARFHLTIHRSDLDRFLLFTVAVLVEEHIRFEPSR